jgi:DNA adenine methylase
MVKPPLKWAGGKTKLAPLLVSLMPRLITGQYFEPFVGAGGLAVYLHGKNLINRAELSDQCSELINFWVAVKEQPTILGAYIKVLTPRLGWCRATYEGLRDWDRDLGTGDFQLIDPLMRAARFWLLNRYGFNGLCRYNSSGEFNVPFGKWKNTPSLITAAELRALSDLLEWTVFGCCDLSLIHI